MGLGWGILGTAKIADDAVAPAIAKLHGSRLVCVASRDEDRARSFAARHGAPAAAAYDELLVRDDVDVVYIATPNALHARHVIAAAAAGKHVLCEKPLATSAEDARAAVRACEEAGVRLGVNFQTRHHAATPELRELVRSGALGEILVVQCEVSPGRRPLGGWRTDRTLAGLGAINNLGVHAYDLIRYLLDSEVVEVTALLDTGDPEELETIALVLLRFANGTLAYVNANQAVPDYQPDLAVYGTRGRIVGQSVTRPFIERGNLAVTVDGKERVAPTSTRDAFDRAIAAFDEAVRAGREPDASGPDGLRSVELTDAITRAARERRVVRLDQTG